MAEVEYESPPFSNWPALTKSASGWSRRWHIELQTAGPAKASGLALVSDEFGTATVVEADGVNLHVEVVTSEAGGPMASVNLSLRMLRQAEESNGPIRRINGQAREAFISS